MHISSRRQLIFGPGVYRQGEGRPSKDRVKHIGLISLRNSSRVTLQQAPISLSGCTLYRPWHWYKQ